tara:strand:- start:174 stop:1187 length:1014 start_codon:yes stop_codon:yes gene_type:complete
MAYTPIDKSSVHFNVVKWTGTSSSPVNVTGFGHNPDFLWNKYAAGAGDHQQYDAPRGATKMIVSNSTNAESTNANGLTAFITDGFTAGSDINVNGGISIAHGWKANGQGSANTDGTINTTYTSANTTSGFSIIKYTGSGSAGTVGHGLGATPDLTIRRKINATGDWFVHTTAIDGSLDFVKLNSTDSKSNSSLTGFTSSTIGVDADSSEEIIYVFKQITGFSKFGTYSTNNNQTNGPFIYLGFKPSFIIAKNISASGYNWVMWNNKLNPRNQSQFFHHHPNTNDTWVDNTNRIDMLSNGFKFYSYDTETNGGGDTILYMAWAEAPLVGSNNVPCTAR